MNDIYKQLSAPFDVTHKKQGLDYLTGEQVTTRLNEVLGFDGWSFRVLEHGYSEEADEYWALGELTVIMPTTTACVTKQQFGSQKPNRYTKDNRIIDLGFDLKGAATDALKKCASLIGVGLYLHEKDAPNGATQQAATAGARGPSAPPAAPPPTTPVPPKTVEKKPFMTFMEELGFTADEVEAKSQEVFDNRSVKDLNQTEKLRLQVALEDSRRKVHA